jgi:ABC-2 type transport system ATP-binding protein
MLKLKNVTKKFGANIAVNDVSFEVRPHEIFVLIGPNGSGKTTIVKMVCGLLRPDGGKIEIGKYDIVKNPIKSKSLLGYIPDEPTVWGKMTGEEFLHFSGALYSLPEKTRSQKIAQWLSVFHLENMEKESFESYSRGNKQKFSIMAAMMHQPRLLLIDEPIVGLDPKSAEIAKRKFSEFAKNGGSIFLVTHTLSFAESIATRIGLLHKGKLKTQGSLGELRAKARLGENANLEQIYKAFTRS